MVDPLVQRAANLLANFRLARGAKRLIRWQENRAAHENGAGPADSPGRKELSEHNKTYVCTEKNLISP